MLLSGHRITSSLMILLLKVCRISINLEEYKKVELSALQCLSVNLCEILKSWFHVLATISSGSSPQFWILPQPKSNLRRNLVCFNLQLTAQYPLRQISEPCSPSTNCSPKTHQINSSQVLLIRISTVYTHQSLCRSAHHHPGQFACSAACSVLPGSASFLHANLYSSNVLCLQSQFQFNFP
ncbi:hypothetical protein ATANTOWER_012394 [Ataeniobius toweri]|uniref:Uncharacterized protein n=1 Tax=Ataeniobius toweri TaxID=208326 RepID=A0ABU7ASI8_9TELE|nr:hypothetical protein [Ataeniobius toweri]